LKFEGDDIVEVIAFFDTIEFTDFWTRIKPARGERAGEAS
jgi:hypothetical protein